MFSTQFLDIPALDSASGTVTLPGSKSISNRVLLLAALSEGTTELQDLLDSDDTRVMLNALRELGCRLQHHGTGLHVSGIGGQAPSQELDLFMGNAGTAMRPLTAALALMGAHAELHGVPRMHERPIADLVDALRQLGCRIDYAGNEGYPPLSLRGHEGLRLDKPIQVRGDVSSQFLTALLLALPLVATQDIVVEVVGELISKPYIRNHPQFVATFRRSCFTRRLATFHGSRWQSLQLTRCAARRSGRLVRELLHCAGCDRFCRRRAHSRRRR